MFSKGRSYICCWWVGGLLGLGLVLGAQASLDDPDPLRYPAWFVHPPSSAGGHWAIGYARTHATWRTSVAEARADAYTRLRRRWGLHISGERLYETVPGHPMAFRGARQDAMPLRDTLRAVTYVDSARVGTLTLILAHAPEPDATEGTLPSVEAPPRSFAEDAPPWVDREQPLSANTVRAVGIAPRYYYSASSWRLAERHARWELAVRAEAQIDRLRNTDSRGQHTMTRVSVDVEMRRVQVIARWQNADACYVLMEAKVRSRVSSRTSSR